MAKARILVVDDSVVVRQLVSNVLNEDPDLEVVGVAANGKIALEKIDKLEPDLVSLDIEMPEMNGLETIAEIRKTRPKLPVIMFSTLTEAGASVTLEALSLGATDYVTKPANVGSVKAAMDKLRNEMIPKIKSLVLGIPVPAEQQQKEKDAAAQAAATAATQKAARSEARTESGGTIDILAIGVSTGGPNALMELLPTLPKDFPVPIVIVQHMPPVFTKSLAERLDSSCQIEVREGTAGEALVPGCAWIAPGDYHMVLDKKAVGIELAMNQEEPENSCRPAVDPLFRSVADVYGARVLAVILTGMGQDGLLGSEVIHQRGGHILAQDEESSVVWGMPGFVAKAGLADKVMPLKLLGDEIIRQVRSAGQSDAAAKGVVGGN